MVYRRRNLHIRDRNVRPPKDIPPAVIADQQQQLADLAEKSVQYLYHAISTTPDIRGKVSEQLLAMNALMRYFVTGSGRYLGLVAGLSPEIRDWVRYQFVLFCENEQVTGIYGQSSTWYNTYKR